MRKLLWPLLVLLILASGVFQQTAAQVTSTITVKGSCRCMVRQNYAWRGSLKAIIGFHVTCYGNGANFIDTHIHQNYSAEPDSSMIAGWNDVSVTNASYCIVIGLRGAGGTYQLSSSYNLYPTIYDAVHKGLHYQISGTGI
jgi:hypothetical protein